MTIDEKLMNTKNFRRNAWNRIKYDKEFEKEFLVLEMKRTIDKRLYDQMAKTFDNYPEKNYEWYFAKNLNLGKSPGKSPYECCLEKDYRRVFELLSAIDYGNIL